MGTVAEQQMLLKIDRVHIPWPISNLSPNGLMAEKLNSLIAIYKGLHNGGQWKTAALRA